MPKQARDLPFPALAVDPAAERPLHRQIYFAVREAILEGRLKPGARLPASRTLSKELGVSRNTVMAAFEQLRAEGYIDGRVGAGSAAATRDLGTRRHAGRAEASRRSRAAVLAGPAGA
jgi:GntR family transcriptional regulator/MocR family aminotransferase